jgi:putative ABC transport system ATP-binding protein
MTLLLDPTAEAPSARAGAGNLTLVEPGFVAPAPAAAAAQDVVKVHGHRDATVRALDGIDLEFEQATFTAVMGPSGSGKSTLLHCLAGLDTPTSGRVLIGDTDLASLDDRKLTRMRRDRVGFVFQAFNLLPTLTAEENICLPLSLAGRKPDPNWFDTVVEVVGLRDRLAHRPAELSGGQQQRVAAARSLITRPEIIFADEPTGNLDSRSGRDLLAFLRRAVDDFAQTIVMVTHDPLAAAWADRIVFLGDGRVVDELHSPSVDTALEHLKRIGG